MATTQRRLRSAKIAEMGEFGDELHRCRARYRGSGCRPSSVAQTVAGRHSSTGFWAAVEAVVEDIPGVTRDRVHMRRGRSSFTIIDTGGWDLRSKAHRSASRPNVPRSMPTVVLVVDNGCATDADAGLWDVAQAGFRFHGLRNRWTVLRWNLEAAQLWSRGG